MGPGPPHTQGSREDLDTGLRPLSPLKFSGQEGSRILEVEGKWLGCPLPGWLLGAGYPQDATSQPQGSGVYLSPS